MGGEYVVRMTVEVKARSVLAHGGARMSPVLVDPETRADHLPSRGESQEELRSATSAERIDAYCKCSTEN